MTLDEALERLIAVGGSDLLFSCGSKPRVRRDGKLEPLEPHAAVLTPDADLSPLERFIGPEVSQVYFEVRSIKFLSEDVAFVDARASQFGSTIMKRAMPAYFVLRRVGGEWRVAVMRVP